MQDNIIKKKFGLPLELYKILIWALILRVILFLIVINTSDPFIIVDDRNYEEIAVTYLKLAHSIWDFSAVNATGGDGYLQVFWPYVVCVFTKLLNTVYAGRILNIFLSLLIIVQTYKLTVLITGKHKRGLLAARLMAFLPYPLIFSVFNIKDFYIMFGVIYTFKLLVLWQYGWEVRVRQVILSIGLLMGVYWARGGVVEFIAIISGIFLAFRYYKRRQYAWLCFIAFMAILLIFNLWDEIVGAFDIKLDTYGDVALMANGLKMIQMRSPAEIYKLPFQYLFSILSPMTISYFSIFSDFSWNTLLALCNVTVYPISFGCLFYLFMKKHNALFYFVTFTVYIIITAMVLAISRHYFFLFFLNVINFVCFIDIANKPAKYMMWSCSGALFIFVLLLSLKDL